MARKKKKVVTYQDTRGGRIDLCPTCEAKFKAAGAWPRNQFGEEYCTVSRGLHFASCDLCQADEAMRECQVASIVVKSLLSGIKDALAYRKAMHPKHSVWSPLERLVGAAAEDYMFMGHHPGPDTTIYLYKHIGTRLYLNISEDDRCWVFSAEGYVPINTSVAIAHATQGE